MIELNGKYNTAKVFTDNVDSVTQSQVIELCNQEFVKDSKIRIMPDTHAGAGCVIGTTMTIKDKVVPNLVGYDIGCGMHVVKLKDKEVDLEKLDNVIRTKVPSGFSTRIKPHSYVKYARLNDLTCKNNIKMERAELSIGTLGGGNHFIELDIDDEGSIYLVIHSGSRNLGKNVAEYYQNLAHKQLCDTKLQVDILIKEMKSQGKDKDINDAIKQIKIPKVQKSLAYLQGDSFYDYINDMNIVQHYAVLNRDAMADVIVKEMGFNVDETFTTIHNYIDTENMILRKGSISAQYDEKVIIPMNMRDGSLICIGKGNEDWNYSAPHGAGRILSRSKAKEVVTLDEYQDSMKGIWTTSVNQGTIDESPMVYKPMQEIIDNIGDTVEIQKIIKPIYNFKASEI